MFALEEDWTLMGQVIGTEIYLITLSYSMDTGGRFI